MVMMDDVASAMLRRLNADFLAVEAMTAAHARAAVTARRQPVMSLVEVNEISDCEIDGPAGPVFHAARELMWTDLRQLLTPSALAMDPAR
jgi:hypothetical protein